MSHGRNTSDWNVEHTGSEGTVACPEYLGRFSASTRAASSGSHGRRGPRGTPWRSSAPLKRHARQRSDHRAGHS